MGLIKTFKPGAQPVIDGVMIRGRKKYAIAMKKSSGNILLDKEKVNFVSSKLPIPLIRGIISSIESFLLSMKVLIFSANYFDHEEKSFGDTMISSNADYYTVADAKKAEEAQSWLVFSGVLVLLVAFLALIFIAPVFIASMFFNNFDSNQWLNFNITEAIARAVLYIAGLFIFKLFFAKFRNFGKYHAAEHMTLNCFELGQELSLENVKKCSKFHPRCGVNIFTYIFVIFSVSTIFLRVDNLLLALLFRFLILLGSIGLGYEISRFFGMFNGKFSRAVATIFGMWTELFTLDTPSDIEIFIAITALNNSMIEDNYDY